MYEISPFKYYYCSRSCCYKVPIYYSPPNEIFIAIIRYYYSKNNNIPTTYVRGYSRAKAYQTVATLCPGNPSRFVKFCLALVWWYESKRVYIYIYIVVCLQQKSHIYKKHNGLFLFIIFIS